MVLKNNLQGQQHQHGRCCCCWVTSVVSHSVRPHRRQPTRLPHPWDSAGKNTGVGCHFLLQCVKVKSESGVPQLCRLLATPWTTAYQAPLSMRFSRQKHWSGVPLPSLSAQLGNLSEMRTLEPSPRPTKWEAMWAAPVICNKRSRWFWNQRISDLEHTSHPSWFSWHLVFFKSLGQFHRRMSHIPDFYDCSLIFGSGLTFWQVWDYFIMLRSTWYLAIFFVVNAKIDHSWTWLSQY